MDIVKKVKFAFLLLLFIGPHFLYGQNKLNLTNIIYLALTNNPEIKSMQNKILMEKENVKSAYGLDDPQIGVEYWLSHSDSMMLTISQMIPFPGKIFTRIKKARTESNLAQQESFVTTLSVLAELKKNYYLYSVTEKKIEIILENIKIAEGMLKNLNALYITGKTPQSDILKMQSEISRMNNMLFDMYAERKSALSMMQSLLNIEKELDIIPAEINKEENFITNNFNVVYAPEIKLKELEKEKTWYDLKMAQWGWFPDFMIGYKYDTMQGSGIMLSITLPLYFFKQSSMVKSMKYNYAMAQNELQASRNILSSQMRELIYKLKAHQDMIQNYQTTIIPLSEQALQLSQLGFKTGRNSFLDFLDSQNRYLQNKMEYYDHWFQQKEILIQIEQLLGKQFDQRMR